ncbi:MAG: hypothetical protein J0L72_00230 [Armatimonadetes bacterium]|nr:hypothetical protein [Armatimonadota bacterium]
MKILKNRLVALGGSGLLLVLGGCAKFPATGTPRSTRLIFSYTMSGPVRTGAETGAGGVPYVYMVAINFSPDSPPPTQGPIPVIAPPWGNGFVAGNATHFVWWDPTQSNDYLIYKFQTTDLTTFITTGVPISGDLVNVGSRRIRFELDLAQMIPDETERNNTRAMQINFLTMDRVPASGTDKQWDALGDGRFPSQINTVVNIPLDRAGTYSNTTAGNIEPTGDQPNPELDIEDWSVEVRFD